jgi:hypothetical protein
MDVQGIGHLWMDATLSHIRCLELANGVGLEQLSEVILGPPLTLALIRRNIWCLHASAIQRQGRAVLLLGHSGQGKSTLARYCDGRTDMPRIADDIIPCVPSQELPLAIPQFPQLKLPVATQQHLAQSANVPLGALVFLVTGPRIEEPALTPISAMTALKPLAEQTVAIGLFDRETHQRHLAYAARLLAQVPAYRLDYPHDYARLPDVGRCIAGISPYGSAP